MPQEQLLERGRVAFEAAHAHRDEVAQRRVESVGVDVEVHPTVLRLHFQVVYAGQGEQPVWRADQLGLNGGTGQVAQLGERAGLYRAAIADDGA